VVSAPVTVAVRFEALGQLQAWRGDTRLSLGSSQQRAVLAVLLLHANRPIGREQLIDAVWGSAAPAYAVNLVQKHASSMRRVLEPQRSGGAPSKMLTWADGAYLLTVPDGALDIDVFDREVSRGRAARASGDLHRASEALHAATGLWRGPACDGLAGPFLEAERGRLAERRVGTIEERVEVDLALGNHLDLIPELTRLVATHPLRERLRGLLMLALYRAGRQAEALVAYLDARRHLVDELGVDPGAELQRLHQQILSADPALAPSTPPARAPVDAGSVPGASLGARLGGAVGPGGRVGPGGSAVGPGSVVGGDAAGNDAAPGAEPGRGQPTPAQLPHGMPYFTGRQAELDQLHEWLAEYRGDGTLLITTIVGTAGVGKSALAVHWAHQVRDRFPDGQLYVNLRGFEPTGSAMDSADAIRGFLDAFGVPPQLIPASLEAQAALYRSLLAGRRMLVVLDNARNADQVRPLLPGSPGCLVVVTSRYELPGLVAEGARPIVLDLLPTTVARELLVRRLGTGRVGAEPAAVDDIIASCAGLPLALTVVAARAASRPGFPLSVLVDQLHQAEGSLDAFDGDDRATDVRAVFSWSYRTLRTEVAHMFRLLGLHAGPSIGTAAAASLAGRRPREAAAALASLAQAHLVEEQHPGRFTFHDLLRAYAAEQVHTDDTEATRYAARHRLLDHYLHSAYAAERLLNPHRDAITLAEPQPGVVPEAIADHRKALAWFTAEHTVLLAAVDQAAEAGFDTHVCQLAWTLTTFFDRRGHWHDSVLVQRAALHAAERLADPRIEARAHRGLARAYMQLGRSEEAHKYLLRAIELYCGVADDSGQGRSYLNLAALLGRAGRDDEALGNAQRALEMFQAAGHRVGQADALNAIGWYHAQLGGYEAALGYCQRALALHQETGDRDGAAHTWDSLGYAHHRLGRHEPAINCYEQATRIWRDLGDRFYEAGALVCLGDVHHAVGDVEATGAAWHLALSILDDPGLGVAGLPGEFRHSDVEQVRAKLRDLGGGMA
jgi:DNA-binding SARP family transcriptional activator/tetratricopeptide (TPR) repeat protein